MRQVYAASRSLSQQTWISDSRRSNAARNADRVGGRAGMIWASLGRSSQGVGPRKEQRNAQSIGRELITMTVRNAFDDAMEPEAAKVIRQLSDGIVGWIEARQLRQ